MDINILKNLNYEENEIKIQQFCRSPLEQVRLLGGFSSVKSVRGNRIMLIVDQLIWYIPYSYKCFFVLEALFVLIFSCTKSKRSHESCSNCPRHFVLLVYNDSLGFIFNGQGCFCLLCEATRVARNFAPHIPLIPISLKMHRFWGKQRMQ